MKTSAKVAIVGLAFHLGFSLAQAANVVETIRSAEVSSSVTFNPGYGQSDTQTGTTPLGLTSATINGTAVVPAHLGQGPLTASWDSRTDSFTDVRTNHGRLRLDTSMSGQYTNQVNPPFDAWRLIQTGTATGLARFDTTVPQTIYAVWSRDPGFDYFYGTTSMSIGPFALSTILNQSNPTADRGSTVTEAAPGTFGIRADLTLHLQPQSPGSGALSGGLSLLYSFADYPGRSTSPIDLVAATDGPFTEANLSRFPIGIQQLGRQQPLYVNTEVDVSGPSKLSIDFDAGAQSFSTIMLTEPVPGGDADLRIRVGAEPTITLHAGQPLSIAGYDTFTLLDIDYPGSAAAGSFRLPLAFTFGNGNTMATLSARATVVAVPEPSTLAMLLAALPLGYFAYRRR
jgi:hypothetical protein